MCHLADFFYFFYFFNSLLFPSCVAHWIVTDRSEDFMLPIDPAKAKVDPNLGPNYFDEAVIFEGDSALPFAVITYEVVRPVRRATTAT